MSYLHFSAGLFLAFFFTFLGSMSITQKLIVAKCNNILDHSFLHLILYELMMYLGVFKKILVYFSDLLFACKHKLCLWGEKWKISFFAKIWHFYVSFDAEFNSDSQFSLKIFSASFNSRDIYVLVIYMPVFWTFLGLMSITQKMYRGQM